MPPLKVHRINLFQILQMYRMCPTQNTSTKGVQSLSYIEPELNPEDDEEAQLIPNTVLVDTKSTKEIMNYLGYSAELNTPVWLEGSTGTGKTAMVKYLAHRTDNPLVRLNLNDMSDVQEIIGDTSPVKETHY
jgi:MoxR-like ATPase